MDVDDLINNLKACLNYSPGLVNCPNYAFAQKQLGGLYWDKGDHLQAIYHLSESHSVGLRQIGILEQARQNIIDNIENDPLSFYSNYHRDGINGLLKRLEEMPSEWTLVQFTREFDFTDKFTLRKANESPKLKNFFLTRYPCGKELKSSTPVIAKLSWPYDANDDIIQSFIEIKKNLGRKEGTSSQLHNIRKRASADVEKNCREIASMCLKEWSCLILGKLYSRALQDEIRETLDKRLDESEISTRQRYLCYLLAESCCHLENAELEVALYQVFEESRSLALNVLESLIRIKETFVSRLHVAKRHPVLLILDDHLDNIPWESLPLLRRHPVSRVYSIHFAHCLYVSHKDYIKDGLREIIEDDVCYYILNPDGNLPTVEERISKFLKKRFPHWTGIIGKKPSEEELIKALTEYNSYVYCGHGNGGQYIAAERIQRLNVKPLQLLYGCNSVGLTDQGGSIEMHGSVMEFALAKSGCTVGMLWPVTCADTDKITMVLANLCLPGHPVDINTFEPIPKISVKKETELLRALRQARDCVDLYSNGAALIARGIPVKLIPKNTTTNGK